MVTKEEVLKLIETRQDAVERAVIVLFNQQTADEQHSERTCQKNGRGFNGHDAAFGSSLVKNTLERGRHLSPAQTAAARRMVKKYAGQIAEIANERQERASQ